MSEIKVRVANLADLRTIRELMIQLYEYFGIEFNEKRFEWGIKKRLKDRLQREGILVAEQITSVGKNIIIGVIVAEILINPVGHSEGCLTNIIIGLSHRGKGYGHIFIDQAIKHLEEMGAEIIKLNLEEDFIKMLDYFKKLGFESKYRVLEYKPK